MAIVFTPPTLHMHYMLLFVHLKFACMLVFVNILLMLHYWRGKSEPLVCACTVKGHVRLVGENRENNSLIRDMNCNWQSDAVKLPRVALNSNSVVDDEDDGDRNSSSETHSDSASMPYQYLIERDIEREKKNSRIAEALSKKGNSNTSADAQGSDTCQDHEVFETFQPSHFVEQNMTNPQSPAGAFGQSIQVFMDENESTELEVLNRMVDDEDEDEDIIPEALVNSSFFNGGFGTIDNKLPSTNHFEGLLMDDIEPNDDKLIHEGRFIKMTTSSSSSRSLPINGSCIINDSLKLPKVISNEIITKDQMPPALLKVLNKSSLESFKSEPSVCNKTEIFSPYNNKKHIESLKNEKKINIVNNSKCNIKNNINLPEENIRITRSNLKVLPNSNTSSYVSNNSPSNHTNYMAAGTQMSLKKSPDQQLNLTPTNEDYEIRYRNMRDNSVSKNVSSFGIDGTLDKRVKINSRKLINDLTYGIKIVVERLDLSRIPR